MKSLWSVGDGELAVLKVDVIEAGKSDAGELHPDASHQHIHETATIQGRLTVGNDAVLDQRLDHLTLGRAALAAALATRNSDFSEAEEQFGVAVDGLRAAGTQDHVPRGLLARAELSRHQCNFPRAERDLRDAEKIARRGEMRLHQTDCHLEWARLHLARHEPAAARDRRDKARTLVNETGYHRRDRDLAEIEQQLEAAAPKSAGN